METNKDSAVEAIMGAFKPGLKYDGMLDYYGKWTAYDKVSGVN